MFRSMLPACGSPDQTLPMVNLVASSTQIQRCPFTLSSVGCFHSSMSHPTVLPGSESWLAVAAGLGSRGLNSSQALHFSLLAIASTVSLTFRQPNIFTSTWFGGWPQL